MRPFAHIPTIGTPRVATGVPHFLGEGPTWDPVRGELLWVDIMAGDVYRGRFAYGGGIQIEERIAFPDTAGAVAISRAGEMVVAGTHRLYFRAVDGTVTAGPEVIGGDERRFNDGKPDPAGRFVVGTKGPTSEEQLVRFETDSRVTVLDDDLSLSNGLAWTRDGRLLYSVDTLTRRIFVRDYDPESGKAGARRLFSELPGDGYPDGITTDADDHLWVAVWGGGCVVRYSPAGEPVGRIDVPAPHVSCVTFAGPDLDTLVITTATENLTDEQLVQYPLAGLLFTIRPGVRGNHPHLWAGAASRLAPTSLEGTE
ncbi:SMP-30/gluconolactonase/LRE family protein [Microbacterium sp. ARD31]|uniref:SMP-30/gluconolactonase/LRE family protein n=1 Tax=Microbacterium sp. ARD31 TaxID=2962576 RepID=UPI0028824034|nr:SMP-30/gluconolactonase/LRE family protein [Microbacterium sp. ARD31]MDT0184035.1 SMP-30/gluconolactonase/LRE family protein [Microbacterium sp. ARD31]